MSHFFAAPAMPRQFPHRECYVVSAACHPVMVNRPIVHKQPFSEEEDCKIRQFVKVNGAKNWNLVAAQLDQRTPKQCRERWHNHLDPSIQKGPWTHAEDVILAQHQAVLGNKWAEIAKFLPGRTDTLVKNRWNTSLKNRVSIDSYGNVIVDATSQTRAVKSEHISASQEGKSITSWLDSIGKAGLADPVWADAMRLPPLVDRS